MRLASVVDSELPNTSLGGLGQHDSGSTSEAVCTPLQIIVE